MMRSKLFGVVATLGIFLFLITGAALADPGKGNPNAPGQQKQATAPVPVQQPSASQQSTASTAAQKSKAPKAHGSAKSKGAASQAGNSSATTAGMKPANNTAKGTHCTTGGSAGAATCTSTGSNTAQAQAKSDASKRYGNGKTAAQIAVSRGGTGVDLYGPGNSQPHKATDCKHKHAVDVHAIKSYSSAACAPSSQQQNQTQTTTASCPSVTVTTLVTGIWHHTGSAKNPYVLIHPSSNSAHMSKHNDDKVATETVTQTSASANCSSQTTSNTSTSTSSNTNTSSNATTSATAQQQGAASNAQASQSGKSGVLGAAASKGSGKLAAGQTKPSRSGGVLGTSGRAAHALGAVATRGKLPFTGFPVWAVLLIGLGLVATGMTLRRRGNAIV